MASRQFRAEAEVLGSIPWVVLAPGALIVLVLIRCVGSMLFKTPSEAAESGCKERALMKALCAIAERVTETIWVLGVSVAAGLLLLP